MSGVGEFAAVVGLGASIIQVIDACHKVKSRIEAFTDDIAFQDVALQLELFAQDLQSISQADLKSRDADAGSAQPSILERVLNGSNRQLCLLDELLSKIIPDPDSSKTHKTFQAIKTFGKDTKVRRLMQTLAEYRSTLNLHLTTQLFTKDDNNHSEHQGSRIRPFKQIPNRRVKRFVGRRDLLESITTAAAAKTTNPTTFVLTGLGGQGKTQTALEFCHVALDHYQIVFWINASSRKSVEMDLSRLYDTCCVTDPNLSDSEKRAQVVLETISSSDLSWLLVFDNYDRPDLFDLTSFFPAARASNFSSYGTILITSRHRECAQLGIHHCLEGLTEEESIELLAYRSSCPVSSDVDSAAARQIVQRLGYLPLAIDQGASYIATRNLALPMFLDHFEERRTMVLNHVPKCSWQYKLERPEISPSSETLSVFTTWELSAANISEDLTVRDSVLQFLGIAANLNGNRIDEEIFRAKLDHLSSTKATLWITQCTTSDEEWDSYAYQDLVVGLASISLIQKFQFEDNNLWFTVHPLVQDWLQLRSNTESQQVLLSDAISMTASVIHSYESEGLSLAKRRTYMQHIDATRSSMRHFLRTEQAKVQYSGFVEGHQSMFATFYEESDRLDDAEQLFTEAYRLQLDHLGSADVSTLATLNNLANLYIKTGRLEQAENLLLLVIKTKESTMGLYEERTLNSINNLGNLYNTQERFAEAKYMYSRALTGYTALLGENHRRTRASASNLGEVNMRMGDFHQAEQLFRRALAGVELDYTNPSQSSLHDSLHYHVLSQLAELKLKLGDSAAALKLFQEAVEGRSRLYGEEHRTTVEAQLRLDAARDIIKRGPNAPKFFSNEASLDLFRDSGISIQNSGFAIPQFCKPTSGFVWPQEQTPRQFHPQDRRLAQQQQAQQQQAQRQQAKLRQAQSLPREFAMQNQQYTPRGFPAPQQPRQQQQLGPLTPRGVPMMNCYQPRTVAHQQARPKQKLDGEKTIAAQDQTAQEQQTIRFSAPGGYDYVQAQQQAPQ